MDENDESREYKCGMCSVIRIGPSDWQTHLNSLTHLCARGKVLRTVFVYDLADEIAVDDVILYFQDFGPLNNAYVDEVENLMMIECSNRNIVRHILKQKQHEVSGLRLGVVPRHPSLVDDMSSPEDISSTEVLLSIMNYEQNHIEGQMNCLISRISLTREQEKRRLIYCRNLETVLRDFFPGCSLVRFGPTVNGTGTKGCDMDLYLDLNIMPYLKLTSGHSTDFPSNSMKDMLSYVKRKQDKSVFLAEVSQMASVSIIELLGEIFKSYVPGCCDVFAQSSARCPLLSFHSEELEIDCEISINSGLAVYNSLLIAFYQNYDRRVRRLCYFVLFWAKSKGLLGSKGGCFSKYAMTMMVILFLQRCNPPVLPTLAKLQSLEDSELTYNGWNCHFSTEIAPSMNLNKLHTSSLLEDFFAFYNNLDLTQNVLLMKSAKVLSREYFSKLTQRDSRFKEKCAGLRFHIVTIQDPFELNRNIAANVTELGYSKWIGALKDHRAMFRRKRLPCKLWGVCAVRSERSLYDIPVAIQPFNCTNCHFEALLVSKDCRCFSHNVTPDAPLAHAEVCTIRAAQVIKEILRSALLFEIHEFPFTTPDDHAEHLTLTSGDAFVDPQRTGYLLDTFLCQSFMNTWQGRKVGRRHVLKSSKRRQDFGSTLAVERAVSRKLTLLRKTHSPVPLCTFVCSLHSYVETTNDSTGVLVQLRAANFMDSDTQVNLTTFLKLYIPTVMNTIINENSAAPSGTV